VPNHRRKILNAGSGPQAARRIAPLFRSADWDETRMDIDPNVQPTIVGSITDMRAQFRNGSFDAVWSSHILEHLFAHEVPVALGEIKRVLRSDGFALVFCPDIESVARHLIEHGADEVAYVSQAGPITALDMLYGHTASIAKGHHFMAHKTGFTADRLGNLLIDAGFAKVNVRRDEHFEISALAFAEHADHRRIEAELAAGGYDLVEPPV
jgi:predicted SAM-dependent methyltransferase